jgi:uncharacterized membrane protein (UPF0182 family)
LRAAPFHVLQPALERQVLVLVLVQLVLVLLVGRFQLRYHLRKLDLLLVLFVSVQFLLLVQQLHVFLLFFVQVLTVLLLDFR